MKEGDDSGEDLDQQEDLPEADKKEGEAETSFKEEFVPDELPPVQEGGALVDPQSPQEPKDPKKRLFFSKLIEKINSGTSMEKIENEIKSKDIIQSLHDNIGKNSLEDDKANHVQTIKGMIVELQGLEREWSALKIDVDEKKKRFDETEAKIREKTEEIKKKFGDIDEIRQQMHQ